MSLRTPLLSDSDRSDQPVGAAASAVGDFKQLDLTPVFTLEGWTRKNGKIGGANNSHADVIGKYTRKPLDDKAAALAREDAKAPREEAVWVKQAKILRNISEIGTFLLKDAMFPGRFAKSQFCFPPDTKECTPNGDNVFIASEDTGGMPLWNHVIKIVMDQTKDSKNPDDIKLRNDVAGLPKKRQSKLGSVNKEPFRSALLFAMQHCKYEGIFEILFAALLSGDFDLHVENIMVIEVVNSDGKITYQLKNIDHDAGLYKLTELTNPHDPMMNRMGSLTPMPTNHINEFPTAWRVSDEFANTINKGSIALSNAKLKKWAQEYTTAIKKYYQNYKSPSLNKLFLELAEWYGLDLQLNVDAPLDSITDIFETQLISATQKRIEFYQRYHFEIMLSNCIAEENGKYILKKGKDEALLLDKLIDNPAFTKYFVDGNYHFRGRAGQYHDYQSNFKVALSSIIDKRVREKGTIEQDFGFYRRVRNAFHDVFNHHNFDRSDKAAFIGRPTRSNRSMSKLTYIEMPFVFAKNLVKVGTEFIPYIFEEGFGYLADRLNKFILNNDKKPSLQKSGAGTIALANLAYYACTGMHYLFKGIRLLGRTITSPVRSFKEAWERDPLLGVASAVCSFVAAVTFTVLLAPIAVPYLIAKGATGLAFVLTHPAAAGALSAFIVGAKTAANDVWGAFKKWWRGGKELPLDRSPSSKSRSIEQSVTRTPSDDGSPDNYKRPRSDSPSSELRALPPSPPAPLAPIHGGGSVSDIFSGLAIRQTADSVSITGDASRVEAAAPTQPPAAALLPPVAVAGVVIDASTPLLAGSAAPTL